MPFDPSSYWYRRTLHPMTCFLLPFSWLFGIGSAIRRFAYRTGIIKIHRFQVPVIVVGNLTVGGTGKTPCVIWLAQWLQSQGYRPGIVSRGVGGKKHTKPYWVSANDLANAVGDEAMLLLQHTACPVVISIDRVAAVHALLQNSTCNIVISDDGLQHYRLGRDIEIALIDGVRGFGNQHLLPAGPLRESKARLKGIDFVIVNGGSRHHYAYNLSFEPDQVISINDPLEHISLDEFPHHQVHAVAGIGHPERFFDLLKHAGFDVIPHPFPDHHLYKRRDLDFRDSLPILMTEKDAVKCRSFVDKRSWYLRMKTKMDSRFAREILSTLKK